MEVLQQVQQVQEKLKQLKILLKLWQNNVSFSTVLIQWILSWLESFSKVLHQQVHGLVSMSLTESTLKSYQSSLNSYLFFLDKKQKVQVKCNFKEVRSNYNQHFQFLSQWIQVMQAVHNFLITSKHFLDQLQWWSLIMQWLAKSCFIPLVLRRVVSWQKRWW